MKRVFIWTVTVLAVAAAFFSCLSGGSTQLGAGDEAQGSRQEGQDLASGGLAADESEIYLAVFRSIQAQDASSVVGGNARPDVVVGNETCVFQAAGKTLEESLQQDMEFVEEQRPGVYGAAMEDYCAKNTASADLSAFIAGTEGSIGLDSIVAELGGVTGAAYWEAFYERAPTACGRLYVSRIGLDQGRRKAVVQVRYNKGPKAGFVDFLFLERQSAGWTVADSLRMVMY